MILFENEYAVIEHEPELALLSLHWKKYTPGIHYREIVGKLYDLRVRWQITRLFSDCLRLPTIGMTDSHWTVEIAKHYALLLPKTHTAIVLSENSFTKLTLDSMNREFNRSQQEVLNVVRYFSQREEARAWLLGDLDVSDASAHPHTESGQ